MPVNDCKWRTSSLRGLFERSVEPRPNRPLVAKVGETHILPDRGVADRREYAIEMPLLKRLQQDGVFGQCNLQYLHEKTFVDAIEPCFGYSISRFQRQSNISRNWHFP